MFHREQFEVSLASYFVFVNIAIALDILCCCLNTASAIAGFMALIYFAFCLSQWDIIKRNTREREREKKHTNTE